MTLGGNKRTIITNSALVPIADAASMVLGLSSISDPYEIYVPEDDPETESRKRKTGMKGWIRHDWSEDCFPFKFDPFLFDASLPSMEPGPAIQKKWDLQYKENELHEWRMRKTDELAFFREHWSGLYSDQYPRDYSKGSRLWVKRNLLKSHLKAQKVALILIVKVAHDVERRYRSAGDKDRIYLHRVFLIESSGEVSAFSEGEARLLGQL